MYHYFKNWNTANLHEDQPVTTNDVPEVEEPYYEIERILRWRKVKRNKKILKEYLILWKRIPSGGIKMGPSITVQSSRAVEGLSKKG